MTSDSFYEYMTNVYYPWLVEKKVQFPVVMWMDNHSSHFTPPLVKFCQEKQIEVMSLYPNATHLIQPLDVSFFKPFKAKWRNFVLSWKNTQNILRLKRKDVARILFSTLETMEQVKEIIKNGFKKSGLHPFDPNAPDYSVLKKKKKRAYSQQDEESVTPPKKSYIEVLESDLSSEDLKEFQKAAPTGTWTGTIEKKALFEHWLRLKGISTGNN